MKEVVIVDYTVDRVALDELIHRVQTHFMSWINKAQQQKVLIGFDGFLDELYRVVRKRSTIDSYELMTSMNEWATQIQKTAGSGTNCETILKDRRTGGFVANTSEALVACGEMGSNLTMMGCFGFPTILPLFQEKFQKKYNCSLYSFGNPGITNAYEFDDGKVMMTNFTPILSIDVPLILNCIPKEKFLELIQHAALFGLGYWSVTPKMSNIFRFFQNEIFPKIRYPLEIFLDLADLRKKTQPDINEAVILIKSFQSPLRVSVSLNDKEAIELAENIARNENVKTQFSSSISDKDFVKIIQFLHSHLAINRFIIHHPRFALMSVRNAKDDSPEIFIIPNAYTRSAKFTVAAGDTFNAGICLGILAGIDPSAMLVLGNVFTSYFIRTGQRGSKTDIHHFMDHYIEYLLVDQSDII